MEANRMNQDTATFVKFGLGGDTVYCGSSTINGYGKPDNPHAAVNKDDRVIPDGTPCLDMREPCNRAEGIHLSISGPMVNPNLEPGQVSRLGKVTGTFADAVQNDPGNQFGQVIALHNAQQRAPNPTHYGSMDEVAVDIYMALWKQVGARTGHYENGIPVWDQEPDQDQEADDTPPPQQTMMEI
jgi:hypothetical protein